MRDFLNNSSFRRWILENDSEDVLIWEKWLIENPSKIKYIKEPREILLLLKSRYNQEGVSEIDKEKELNRLIEKLTDATDKRELRMPLHKNAFLKTAAAIIVFLGILFLLVSYNFWNR